MSNWEEKRANNKRLRNLVIAWIVGAFVIGIAAGAIIFLTSRPEPDAVIEDVQPTLAAEQPVVTVAPQGHQAQVEVSTLDGSAADEQPPAVAKTLAPLDAFGYGIQVHGSVGEPEMTIEIGRAHV